MGIESKEIIAGRKEVFELLGTDMVLEKYTNGTTDSYGEVLTKENIEPVPIKATIPKIMSDGILSKVSDTLLNNTAMYIEFQTDQDLNDGKFTIKYDNKSYEINFANKDILQGDILGYEVLLKK